MDRNDVFEVIDKECDYQRQRFSDTKSSGTPSEEFSRSIDEFALYICQYSAELMKYATHGVPRDKLDIMRKIAALCVSCGEQHGMPERYVIK